MKISTNDRREMIYSLLKRSRRAESNDGEIMFLRAFYGEILSKTSKIGIFIFSILRHLTFCWISRHPMVIERRISHHSIRPGETILMSHRSSSYDHWLPRYSAKCQMAQYRKPIFDISPNISASNGHGKTN